MQVSLLVEPLFDNWWDTKITIDTLALLKANLAAAAFLISFGGNIGKLNPTQLVVMVVLESIFYSLNNQRLLNHWLHVSILQRNNPFWYWQAYIVSSAPCPV